MIKKIIQAIIIHYFRIYFTFCLLVFFWYVALWENSLHRHHTQKWSNFTLHASWNWWVYSVLSLFHCEHTAEFNQYMQQCEVGTYLMSRQFLPEHSGWESRDVLANMKFNIFASQFNLLLLEGTEMFPTMKPKCPENVLLWKKISLLFLVPSERTHSHCASCLGSTQV